MRGLLEVVAQNVRVVIVIAHGGVISKVYGQPWPQMLPLFHRPIGNLRAGERGSVMLALKPDDFKSGAVLEVTARLTYDAPEISEPMVRTVTARAVYGADESVAQGGTNEDVILCGAVMDAMDLAIAALHSDWETCTVCG